MKRIISCRRRSPRRSRWRRPRWPCWPRTGRSSRMDEARRAVADRAMAMHGTVSLGRQHRQELRREGRRRAARKSPCIGTARRRSPAISRPVRRSSLQTSRSGRPHGRQLDRRQGFEEALLSLALASRSRFSRVSSRRGGTRSPALSSSGRGRPSQSTASSSAQYTGRHGQSAADEADVPAARGDAKLDRCRRRGARPRERLRRQERIVLGREAERRRRDPREKAERARRAR